MFETAWETRVRDVETLLSAPLPIVLRLEGVLKPHVSFDLVRVIAALPNVSIEKGYALDWIYCWNPNFDGYPVLRSTGRPSPCRES
jgi:hypothetical protein